MERKFERKRQEKPLSNFGKVNEKNRRPSLESETIKEKQTK